MRSIILLVGIVAVVVLIVVAVLLLLIDYMRVRSMCNAIIFGTGTTERKDKRNIFCMLIAAYHHNTTAFKLNSSNFMPF